MKSKVCTKCKIEKQLSEFSTKEKGGRLLKSSCTDCERARGREYSRSRSKTREGQYKQHKENAKIRGVAFNLSFDEWLCIWSESGKLHLRGKGRHKYCMCRLNDEGAYEVGNVFISTNSYNLSSGNKGKIMSAETRAKISTAHKGKPHPWSAGANNPMHRPEVKVKMSKLIGGANNYKARGIITPDGFFATAKLAAEAIGMKKSTVEWRARHNKFGFSLPAIA
jgi:hypothetical protein